MSPLAWTVWLLAAILFAALAFVRVRAWRRVVARLVGRDGQVVAIRTRGYLELWLRRGRRETLQGRVSLRDPLVSGVAYTDGFHLYPPAPGARVLFVGAGTGIGPRQFRAFYPEVEVTVVEHEPAVLAIAAEVFDLQAGPGLVVETGDGRERLERSEPASFDVIVLDTFGAGVYPARLATLECFRLCRDRLREPGMLVVNLGGTLAARRSRLPDVWAGIVEAFGADKVLAYGVPLEGAAAFDPTVASNTLAFAFRGAIPAPGRTDRAPRLAAIAASPVTPPGGGAPLRDGVGEEALDIV